MLQKLRDYTSDYISQEGRKKSAIEIDTIIWLRWANVNAFLPNERFRSGAYWKFTLFKLNVKEIASLIKEARSV